MRTERCDIKVWSGACEHGSFSDNEEKYLCEACETIPKLDHEVRRDGFVHVSGDTDMLS